MDKDTPSYRGYRFPAEIIGVLGLLVLFGGAIVAAWDDKMAPASGLGTDATAGAPPSG